MNKVDKDIILELYRNGFISQRILAEHTGHSLGNVNASLKRMTDAGYVDEQSSVTKQTREILAQNRTSCAIILAAGGGMRMAPINSEVSKGLLEINGEIMIERLINQLHQVGVEDITVVVGFMKESYEYLIDKYGVSLCINMEYAHKNNLHSLYMVREKLKNCYIIPCDLWFEENPFHREELYSWYMVTEAMSRNSSVKINRKGLICKCQDVGNKMVGLSYVHSNEADVMRQKLEEKEANWHFDNEFWECVIDEKQGVCFQAVKTKETSYTEINTYEDLRELDSKSKNLRNDAMTTIAKVFDVGIDEIRNVKVLKKGMTNRSFQFDCKEKSYIMRIPGEGTEQLINRAQEYEVYQTIKPLRICDEVFYMNPESGYKVSEYLDDARVSNSRNWDEVKECCDMLKAFHEKKLRVGHRFDIFKQIEFYENLWNGAPSVYQDYNETKKKVYQLKEYIDANKQSEILCHIDANCDNFLYSNGRLYLIDWEYAAMQDPNVDIAMYAIYAMYDKDEVDRLIDVYYENGCEMKIRKLIYCYVAVCGFLWSNWCEYKRQLGVEFGEYSIRQYRYAKEYYAYFMEEEE